MKVILHLSQSIMSTSNNGNAINYPISSKYCHIVHYFLNYPHKNIEDGLKFNPIKLSTMTYSNDCSCNSVGVVAHIFLDLEPDNGRDFYK